MALCTIETHASSFRSGAKSATKRHRSFVNALKEVLEQIEKDPYSVGDPIKSSNPEHVVRKVRIGAPGERVLPRAGYRLIYQLLDGDNGMVVRCLDLFYKPEQATVLAHQVERLASLAVPNETSTEGVA